MPAGSIPSMREPGPSPRAACAVRPMGPEDLPFVVSEHRAHFPDGFFARLGTRFLTAYTATYLASPHARAYVVEAEGRPVGFLVGLTDPGGHRAVVLRAHGRRLAVRACAGLTVRPALAWHFLHTRLGRYCRKLIAKRGVPRCDGAVEPRDGLTAVLAHVVVIDRICSHGLGRALIERFCQDAADAGCARVSLVTAAGAEGAGAYYERIGWRRMGEMRTPEGRMLSTYEYELDRSEG